MTPGAIGVFTFLGVYAVLLLGVFIVTRPPRSRGGVPSAAHPWIAAIAAIAALLVAIDAAGPNLQP